MGDGRGAAPGGVEQYLASREGRAVSPSTGSAAATSSAGETRQARKDLARTESQLATVETRISQLHDDMAAAASDYVRLAALTEELNRAETRRTELEERHHPGRRLA